MDKSILKSIKIGENAIKKKIQGLLKGGVYFIVLESPYEKASQKIILEP